MREFLDKMCTIINSQTRSLDTVGWYGNLSLHIFDFHTTHVTQEDIKRIGMEQEDTTEEYRSCKIKTSILPVAWIFRDVDGHGGKTFKDFISLLNQQDNEELLQLSFTQYITEFVW